MHYYLQIPHGGVHREHVIIGKGGEVGRWDCDTALAGDRVYTREVQALEETSKGGIHDMQTLSKA